MWAVTQVDGTVKRIRAHGYEHGDTSYAFYTTNPETGDERTPVGEIVTARVWSVVRELPEDESEADATTKRFQMVLIAITVAYLIFG